MCPICVLSHHSVFESGLVLDVFLFLRITLVSVFIMKMIAECHMMKGIVWAKYSSICGSLSLIASLKKCNTLALEVCKVTVRHQNKLYK